MQGRWRAFRHNSAGSHAGHALFYILFYALCIGITYWNLFHFDAVILWAANGVLLAAYLQLPKRLAIPVLVVCFGIDLSTSLILIEPLPFGWSDPVLNLTQVLVAGVLTRRLCGPGLDLRKPWRIFHFTFGAALPAVTLTTFLNVTVLGMAEGHSLMSTAFLWRHMFAMELLGLVIFTPCLLLLGGMDRTPSVGRSLFEIVVLLGLQILVTALVFSQAQPFFFCIIMSLMLLAYRLPPTWVAVGLLLTTLIGASLSLFGMGPVNEAVVIPMRELAWAPDLLRQVPILYGLLLSATVMALLFSALISDRRLSVLRMARRSRKALEEQEMLKAAAQAKARFLAMLNHEMRTPLNAITGFCEVLGQRQDLPNEVQSLVRQMAESSDNLLYLIEDMLDASGGDRRLKLVVTDLETVLRAAIAEEVVTAFSKGITIRLEMNFRRPMSVLCDPLRFRSALRHVVGNAVKFSKRGEVQVLAYLRDDLLVLNIKDQGPGIAADFIPEMFDMFSQGDNTAQRHHGGAGAGLAVARHHARSMGGDVVLVTTSAQGTTMQMTARIEVLPSEMEKTPAVAEVMQSLSPPLVKPVQQTASSMGLRLLVVDDHPLNRSVLRLMAEGAGYQVDEAGDGHSAVHKVAAETYDLVLMDVRMPGMDGLEATRQIRAQEAPQARVPIMAVTADAMADSAAVWREAGMNGYLTKPFTREALLSTIEAVLEGGAGRPIEAS